MTSRESNHPSEEHRQRGRARSALLRITSLISEFFLDSRRAANRISAPGFWLIRALLVSLVHGCRPGLLQLACRQPSTAVVPGLCVVARAQVATNRDQGICPSSWPNAFAASEPICEADSAVCAPAVDTGTPDDHQNLHPVPGLLSGDQEASNAMAYPIKGGCNAECDQGEEQGPIVSSCALLWTKIASCMRCMRCSAGGTSDLAHFANLSSVALSADQLCSQ